MADVSLRTDDTPEDVVRAYAPMVYRLAYARAGNRADADDIFQEVFLRYFCKNPAFSSEAHRRAWLLRVTANCAGNLWALAFRRHTVPLEEDLVFHTPEETGLHAALCALPAHYRIVVHLFYYEALSVEEISRLLGRGPSTVRTQLTRARRRLKELLREQF